MLENFEADLGASSMEEGLSHVLSVEEVHKGMSHGGEVACRDVVPTISYVF